MPLQGMQGMQWQTVNLPFRAGLLQKSDDRARPQPFLDICKDAQFDELGGLQTRFPFAAIGNSIFGGGTLSNCRRLAVVNDELVVFTDTAMYSWNAQLSKWVLRGTHLAIEVNETPRFTTTGDQVDGDRAELSGTIVYAWTEGTTVYAAAMDKTTGSVLVAPTAVSTAIGRPRLIALATKILFFVDAGSNLLTVRAIDPAAPGTAISGAGTTVLATNFNSYYDVVRAGTQDLVVGACRRVTTTSYTVFTVTPALAVTTSTKARTADGPLAVATIPDGTKTQVVRGNGTNIQGDLITTSSLADIFTGQAIGSVSATINQLTAAYSGVQVGGFDVAQIFWSREEATTGTGGFVITNTVNTNNSVGAAATVVPRLGLASRAFAAGGRVFVWCAFARTNEVTGLSGVQAVGVRAQLQNTYYLYRDDAFLAGKAAFDTAGGHSPSTGQLPGVGATSGTGLDFAWAAARRRVLDLGGETHTGFAARSLIDVTMSYDSNHSRRTAATGRTLYVGDSIPLQYDGTGLYEVGFLVYPYNIFATAGGAGAIPAGVYIYKSTTAWQSSVGEKERSTTAFGAQVTAPGANITALQLEGLNVTKKTAARIAPSREVWRTAVTPGEDAPFYRVTGDDPNSLASAGVNNGYVPNDATASVVPSGGFGILNDNFTDAILTTKETNPENGGFLESLAPPGASIIIATDTRIFLAGVAGDPDAVWYSRQRNEGEVASFHDNNRALVPRPGGDITSIAIHNETLAVFRETAIYRLAGDGFTNAGTGQNLVAFRVATDVGAVNHESVATTPLGTIFKSRKGWYLLDLGWVVRYIGDKVTDYDSETVYSVDVVETQHQVRILTSGRMLVWDYSAATPESPLGQWGEWTISDGLHSVIWNGTHVYLTATGPKQQSTTYAGVTYGMDVERTWKLDEVLQGASRCRKVQPFGEYRSSFKARVRIAYDYKRTAGVPDYVDDKVWTPSPATVGGPLQFSHAPRRPICESITVRITAIALGSTANLDTSTFFPTVTTSGTDWAAAFLAVPGGEAGNAVMMQISFVDGTPFSIDVRDHFVWNTTSSIWVPSMNAIGVLVRCRTGSSPTVAQLQAAIIAGTALATLSAADATPGKIVSASAMAGITTNASFTGGTYGSPTGEALKLTSLGLEVGVEPGLFRRLPKAQQQ